MRGLIYSSLAAAVIMAMSGTASADYRGDRDETGATLTKKVKAEVDVEYEGRVNVGGYINVNKLGMAVVDNQQSSSMIGTANTRTENTSKIDGSFKGASGNIGANVAAGDSTYRATALPLAAYDEVDAEFIMGRGQQQHGAPGGSSDAEVFSTQSASNNWTTNHGHQNKAGVGDGAFKDAAGNIGVNVTSGSGNVQANNMAASVSTGNMAVATVANSQSISKNMTENQSLSATKTVDKAGVFLGLKAWGGDYEGAVPVMMSRKDMATTMTTTGTATTTRKMMASSSSRKRVTSSSVGTPSGIFPWSTPTPAAKPSTGQPSMAAPSTVPWATSG